MCEHCFNTEWNKFESYKEHEEFQKVLAMKKNLKIEERLLDDLGEPKIWLFGFFGIGTKRPFRRGFDVFKCSECGYQANADFNGAKNILKRSWEYISQDGVAIDTTLN